MLNLFIKIYLLQHSYYYYYVSFGVGVETGCWYTANKSIQPYTYTAHIKHIETLM